MQKTRSGGSRLPAFGRTGGRVLTPWLGLLALVPGCRHEPPPGERTGEGGGAPIVVGQPTLPPGLQAKGGASPPASAAPGGAAPGAAQPKHPGPWLVVTAPAGAVYSVREFEKEKKLGYVKNGGHVPVKPTPVPTKSCTAGWYDVIGGGYICGNLGTTDLEHPQVKFALRQPDLESVLPYQYARNAKNGTPLYKSVPSREQMLEYEPYLDKHNGNDSEPANGTTTRSANAGSSAPDGGASEWIPLERLLADAGIGPLAGDAGASEPERPWWQRDDASERLHEVKLAELSADADDVLAKRLVSGFYIAIDKTFNWNGRAWYKTTKGLVAPADRFWQTAGAKFQGIEIDGNNTKLPIGWTYGGRKTAPLYEIDADSKKVKPAESVDVFSALKLTGRELDSGGTRYAETRDQKWVKLIHVRVTRPGPPPQGLGPNERWVDVNLKEQTLVLFEGTRPVYATLVSTGKESKIEDKDHRTPSGEWRIREKHITTTMDGDGTAAGDLPYSIEDVPYVVYFNRSYALHGAFWHRNFGVQMSHGCVNLAPLDARRVFFFTDPPLPEAWHGAWATPERPGSRVVIHE